jgi:hypothetical protein
MWIHDGVFDRRPCSIAINRNSQGYTQALTWCSSRFLWGRTPHCHTQGCRPHHPHACLHLRTAVQEIHLAADCPTAALAVCSSPLSCDLLVTEEPIQDIYWHAIGANAGLVVSNTTAVFTAHKRRQQLWTWKWKESWRNYLDCLDRP